MGLEGPISFKNVAAKIITDVSKERKTQTLYELTKEIYITH